MSYSLVRKALFVPFGIQLPRLSPVADSVASSDYVYEMYCHPNFVLFVLSNYLTEWKFWPAEDFSFRGHKYIMKKVRVVSLAYVILPLSLPLPNTIKISQTI